MCGWMLVVSATLHCVYSFFLNAATARCVCFCACRWYELYRKRLGEVAENNGERLLQSNGNTISFAITLDTLVHEVSRWTPAHVAVVMC